VCVCVCICACVFTHITLSSSACSGSFFPFATFESPHLLFLFFNSISSAPIPLPHYSHLSHTLISHLSYPITLQVMASALLTHRSNEVQLFLPHALLGRLPHLPGNFYHFVLIFSNISCHIIISVFRNSHSSILLSLSYPLLIYISFLTSYFSPPLPSLLF
jgi:hypothetical protein